MKKPLILIVEDDEWLAEQQLRTIKLAGYKAQVALNTFAAVKAINKTKPDAIILDVLLAGTTAFALLQELQSYGDTCSIPIVLCTNIAGDLSLDEMKPYGVKRILDKSNMLPADLVAALRSVLL